MWNIIDNELKSFFRKPYLVIMLIAFPISLIFFLGNFLEDVETSDDVIESMTIGYHDEKDQFGAVLEEIDDETIHLKQYQSEEDGCNALRAQEVDCFVEIGEKETVLYEGTNVVCNESVSAILHGIEKQRAAMMSVVKQNPKLAETLGQTIEQVNGKSYVKSKDTVCDMSMMDYYTITMTIMTAVFGALATSMSFTEERGSKTINRLLIAPCGRWKIFAGKIIGTLPQAVCQVTVTLFCSIIFFHSRVGFDVPSMMLIYLTLLLVALCSNAVGVLAGFMFKGYITVVLFAVIWLMLFFSGCFAKVMAIEPFCNYLPPTIIKEAILNYSIFQRVDDMIPVIGVSIIGILVAILIGGIAFQRKQEER